MPAPILATKLYLPPARPKAVQRRRLIERLNEGLQGKLTLISAPAGFGKTTLVSEWLAVPSGLQGRTVAWLSLDEGDSDPARFLAYFVAALQTIAPQLGEEVLGVLQSAQPPPIETILAALLNEITATLGNFVLVLDDYHLIEGKAVGDALTFVIEHLPPQMHLVIATREDPRLPLARLRARGQMTEVRAADLRFTPAEAAGFLQTMNLNLSAEEVTALERRTEGWIAGLQLAALSIRGHQDVAGFIRAFTGDNRYIVDYLVEEVLQRQPEAVRNFLLQTAILEQLNGPLCAAVTGQTEANARLEALERGNFFVVPLDDKRHWYRYHHLFADVLQAHLLEEQPDQVPELHRRASAWYAQNDSPAEAIRHALAAKDFARAAELIEPAVPAMRRSRQEATLLGWLQALPDELLHDRPVLSVHYAGALLTSGKLEGVELRLRDAQRGLETTAAMNERVHPEGYTPTGHPIIIDAEGLRTLPGWLAVYHAGYSLARGDVAGTRQYAQRALELVPEQEYLQRGAAASLLGLAYWTEGDLEAAHHAYATGMASLQKAGHTADVIGCAIALADIRIEQGRLHEAMHTYERALQLATNQGLAAGNPRMPPALRGTADIYVGISELYRERNDLQAATDHLLKSKALGDHMGLPRSRFRWCVVMARIREAEGDLEGALNLFDEAEALYVGDFFPNVRPVAAMKTRVWVMQGRVGEALGWAREQGLSAGDDLSYLREFEHITLARIFLARYKNDHAGHSFHEAMELLERLLHAAQAGAEGLPRTKSVIELLGLQALAHYLQDDLSTALMALQQALALAEPEEYVRIFVDEGPPMAQLLREVAARRIMPVYTTKLLAAFASEQPMDAGESPLLISTTSSTSSTASSPPLIEALSQRELEVLRLLRSELSGPEIARQLVVSLNTLNSHTKNIYSKLGVNNRRAAVRRAEELDLF